MAEINKYDETIDKVVSIFNSGDSKEFCESVLEQALNRLHKKLRIT